MQTQSILLNIKKLLGLSAEYVAFDQDIIIHINTAFMSLNQLGIGPEKGVIISGVEETWYELLGDKLDLEGVKTYIYLKVRLVFDPPTSSFVLEAFKKNIEELEFRLKVQAEVKEETLDE